MKYKESKIYYKIWDISKKKYISGARSKTTWNSIRWVNEVIKNLCNDINYGHCHINGRKIDEFEIHKMEMKFNSTINPIDISNNDISK